MMWMPRSVRRQPSRQSTREADAEATLVAKLKAGKEHPAVKTSDDDNKGLVKWILGM
jgi:hypothetical protein